MKTKKWSMGISLCVIAIIAAMGLFLAGCDNPATNGGMGGTETEYMYSDLSIEKAVWEIVSGGMTDIVITLTFDEPVRIERTGTDYRPFTVTYDYNGTATTKNPNVNTKFPASAWGGEKAAYQFSIMVSTGDTASMFSKVKFSYAEPTGTKIITAYGDVLKNFSGRPLALNEGGGMGGM
ncbi:hypothetical protein AGMMS50268_33230 [Spirochaetia bacterium]|nr:hypothetical protein AGMMS50268_33230 [Spirochaetia bacterium]